MVDPKALLVPIALLLAIGTTSTTPAYAQAQAPIAPSEASPSPSLPAAQSSSESIAPPNETTPPAPVTDSTVTDSTPATSLDLDPQVIEDSPVLQRWSEEVPDVLSEIRHDPSFRTRVRLGYSQFPAIDHASGFSVGIEDVFVGRSGFTLSGDYQDSEGDRQSYGADLRYYVLPLGSYVNVAPVLGYRHLETEADQTEGVNLGLRLLLALSRTGAADLSVTQSWVAPGSDQEAGITTFSFGYALTPDLRLSTEVQQQNMPSSKDRRIGIGLEWLL
jgi:hypothetical protein